MSRAKDKSLVLPLPKARDLARESEAHAQVRAKLNNDLDELYEQAKKLALGKIYSMKVDPKTGVEEVYLVPPDPKVLMYLMDRAMGRVPIEAAPEKATTAAVKTLGDILDKAIEERRQVNITPRPVPWPEPITIDKRDSSSVSRDELVKRILNA